jgi:hypothetical protein
VGPLVKAAFVDGCLFACALGVQQLSVVLAVVNGFQHCVHRQAVFPRHFVGSQWLRAYCLAIKDLGADATNRQLRIARAALGCRYR